MKCKPVVSILLCVTIVLTASCWDRREPEETAFVIAVGFDYDTKEDQYEVIAQIANPLGLGSQGDGQGGGNEQEAFWTLTAQGQTPKEAMRNLAQESSRELFWAHITVVLFSEELARHGIGPVLEVFERDRQLRSIARPAVVEGDLATVLSANYPLEDTGGRGLRRQMVTITFERALFPTKTLRELYTHATRAGREIFLGRVQLLQDGTEEEGGDGQNAMTPNPVRLGGGAIFKGDRMLGWLDEGDTIGWNWIEGRVVRTVLTLKNPQREGEFVFVEITESQTRVKPVKSGEGVQIQVWVKAEGRIEDTTSPLELTPGDIQSLERRMAEEVRNDIRGVLNKAQALNADILGFGDAIHRKMPREWGELAESWDELFPMLEVKIDVEAHLRRAGLILDSLKFR